MTKERSPDEVRGRCAEARDRRYAGLLSLAFRWTKLIADYSKRHFLVTDERVGVSSSATPCCLLYLLALSYLVALGYSVVDECNDLRRAERLELLEDASHLFILAGRF